MNNTNPTPSPEAPAPSQAALAAECYVLMKRGYFWPNAAGYTDSLREAWKITKAEAETHANPCPLYPVTMHHITEFRDKDAHIEMLERELEYARATISSLTIDYSELIEQVATERKEVSAATQLVETNGKALENTKLALAEKQTEMDDRLDASATALAQERELLEIARSSIELLRGQLARAEAELAELKRIYGAQ